MKAIKFPFVKMMEQTLHSLEECKFEVKGEENYNVYCKSIIVVGPLPSKELANNIAQEYNWITEKRKENLVGAIGKVSKLIVDVCNDVENSFLKSCE